MTLLAAWSRDATHGINEMTQQIPRAKFGGGPDDPAVPLIAIVDDQTDPGVAKSLAPSEMPCIMLFGDSDAPVEYNRKPAREIALAAAFCTEEDADPLEAARLCGYYMRGARRSFFRFNHQSYSRDYRKLNGVLIMEISKVTEQRVTAAEGRHKMWGFLDVRAIVVDDLQ